MLKCFGKASESLRVTCCDERPRPVDGSLGSRLPDTARRLWVLAILGAVVSSMAIFVRTVEKGLLGIDFGVFHAGGRIIRQESFAHAYDPVHFTELVSGEYYGSLGGDNGITHFISPPPFGWTMQAISIVPFELALSLWFVASVLAVVVAVYQLRLPGWVSLVVLVAPAMWVNWALGQTGAFVLLLFAALHQAMVRQRLVLSGILLGLLVLKPTLAVGYGLWLVVDRSRWRYIPGAAIASLIVISPTVVRGFEPWRDFLRVVNNRIEVESSLGAQAMSMPEFLKLLSPNSGPLLTMVWWSLSIAIAAVLMLIAVRRFRGDTELLSAVAVLISVGASPHLFVYDTAFLLVPVAVLYRRGALSAVRTAGLAAWWSIAIALGSAASGAQMDLFGRSIGIEFISLVIAAALGLRWLNECELGPPRGEVTSGTREFVIHR